MIRFSKLFLILGLATSMLSCHQENNKLNADQGRLAITANDWHDGASVELNGQWGMYWQQLLSPAEAAMQAPDTFVQMPGIWFGQHLHGAILPGTGYATYTLRVFFPADERHLSLRSSEFFTAYKLWVNDSLLAQSGEPATTKEATTPALKPLNLSFELPHEARFFDITIQLANFHHSKGGIWDPIVLSTAQTSYAQRLWHTRTSTFLMGFILMMAAYYLVVFLLLPSRKSELYFTIFTGAMVLRLFITDERMVYDHLSFVPFELLYKLEYLTGYFNVLPMALFFSSLFSDEFGKWGKKIIVGLGLFGTGIVLVFPTYYSSQLVLFFMAYAALSGLYAVLWVLPRALWHKRVGAFAATVGIGIFFLTGSNDMLKASGVLHTPHLMPIGLAIYVFLQAVVLAVRFIGFYKQNLQLTNELNFKNQNLEKIVAERTYELRSQTKKVQLQHEELNQRHEEILTQRDELNQRNEEIMAQRDEMKAQGDALVEANRELRQHAELVKASISYATTIQQAMLPKESAFDDFSEWAVLYEPKDIVSGDFYWASSSRSHPGRHFLAVVDCTGHGVPGGFVSILGGRLLNEIIRLKRNHEPAQVLHQLDEGVKKSLQQDTTQNNDGMDLSLLRLDALADNKWQLCYSGAKQHLLIWQQETRQLQRYSGTRKSIGGRSRDKEFEQQEFVLERGDVLYLYSDGIIDQGNPKGKRFGTTRFMELIGANAAEPITAQRLALSEALAAHQQNAPRRDDITVLMLRL